MNQSSPHRWWRLFRRAAMNAELDEELRTHLRMAVQERIAAGESPDEAERNVRREFGNVTLVSEQTRAVWGWGPFDRRVQDLRYAVRQIRRKPGFALAAIASLGLGLGATTAMFSVVNGTLLQPMNFRQPERLFVARNVALGESEVTGDAPVNSRHFHEWRSHCTSCESVSLIGFQQLTLVGVGEPMRLPGLQVSANIFRTLGVAPAYGRDFLPEEDKPGRSGNVILSHRLWRSRFQSDPSLIGREIHLNGEMHTVVGILGPDVHLPRGDQWGDFFGPPEEPLIFRGLGFDASRMSPWGSLNYTSVVRLKPDIPVQRAEAELNSLLAGFDREFRLETRTVLIPLREQVTRTVRTGLWLLLASVGTVLLIVCVNMGNLMLARMAGRAREAGVRLALGAHWTRLFLLAMTEATLLAGLGGALGWILAGVAVHLISAASPVDVPRLEEAALDWRVLLFAMFATGSATLICGLIPAWRLARVEPFESLKAASAGSGESAARLRLGEILVSAEVALCTVLLIAGGLLLVSFVNVINRKQGFDLEHVIAQDVSFLNPKYARGNRRHVVEDLTAQFARIPGVVIAGGANRLPLRGEEWVDGLRDADHPERLRDATAAANFRFVTPGYWQALGIPLLRGRYLNDSDRGKPRAVLSERAARYLWPDQNPIGKRVRGAAPQKPPLEVVGVVGDVPVDPEQDAPMMVYEHFWRTQPVAMSFVIRTRADPNSTVRTIRQVLSRTDPEMAIPQALTMRQILDGSVSLRRFQTWLAGSFAGAALLLASFGVYGVLAHSVARRGPELGIRMALGAQPRQVIGLVLRQGMRPVVIGLAWGLALSFLAQRLITSQLYGVAANDAPTFGTVVGLLLVVAAGACSIPARRATRIDPVEALRAE